MRRESDTDFNMYLKRKDKADMKKLISLLLALMMVLSLATVAFASEVTPSGGTSSGTSSNTIGSITINKYNKDNNYILYRMLELESFNTSGEGAYSYKIMANWEDFFNSDYAQQYVSVEGDYIKKKTSFTDSVAPEFALKALEYVNKQNSDDDHANDIDSVRQSNHDLATGTTTSSNDTFPYYTFKDLDLGYYLVDSSMGALCGLTTTNPNASINAKNGEPTLDKYVHDDSKDEWDLNNTASIGDTVKYRVFITVQAGAQDYIFHDKMSDGLTFDKVTSITYDNADVASTNYEIHRNCTEPDCVCASCNKDCTFHIIFDTNYCKTLSAGKSLVIYYQATLNKDAVIANNGETNSATLEFGEEHFTKTKTVNTRTYAFDLVKTDGQNFLLDGAKFTLWTKTGVDDNGKDVFQQVSLVKVIDNKGTPDDDSDDTFYYRPTEPGETGLTEAFEVEGGLIRFQGFAPGDYYFEETEAPQGFNKLTEKQMFTLYAANQDAIFNNNVYSATSGFQIQNQSGAMLPETGATGTTMFIFFGMFVMLSTGVLLVTKKRMSMIEE